MVARYVPRAGDIIWLDFDPQTGREQSKRRPALVVTEESFNRASGFTVVCPLTSRRKPYPLLCLWWSTKSRVRFLSIKSRVWTGQ